MSEETPRVVAFCNTDGWYFEANGKRLGPFSIEEMDDPRFEVDLASQLGVEPKEIPAAMHQDYTRELDISELNEFLSTTVKRDEPSKAITFLGMLLAQTEEDQYNIGFQAESSTGKSYIPLELVEYFPQEERKIYAGASPTSFFHEVGFWDKEAKVIRVDLERKILIFMDQPHWMLMEKLRPLLSHDRKVLTYKITDKTGKGGLRTKTVELTGYPTVIFCTTKPTLEDQERTRLWLLSPETSPEKLRETLHLIAKREGNREAFQKRIKQNPTRHWLKVRVAMIRTSEVRNIIIPNEDEVYQRFLDRTNHLTPRAQRDFPRLLRLIKGLALLNCFLRESPHHGTIIASAKDVEEGFRLYETCAKSNELGLSPEIYEIYERVIIPLASDNDGVSRKDICKKYWEVYGRPLRDDRLRREILPSLESAGLIREGPNPIDRREMLVYCTVPSPISPISKNLTNSREDNGLKEYRGKNSAVTLSQRSQCADGKLILFGESTFTTQAQPLQENSVENSRADSEKPALGELLPKLLSIWVRGTCTEFDDLLVEKHGLSRDGAELLRENLIGKGLLAYDPDGLLVWTKAGG